MRRGLFGAAALASARSRSVPGVSARAVKFDRKLINRCEGRRSRGLHSNQKMFSV